LVELVELVALGALAVLAALAALVVLVGSVAGIARQLCRPADAATGSTIPHTAVERRIEIAQPPTALAAQRVVIRSLIARQAPGNSLGDRVATWPATAREEPDWVIAPAVAASAVGPEREDSATGQAEAEVIA